MTTLTFPQLVQRHHDVDAELERLNKTHETFGLTATQVRRKRRLEEEKGRVIERLKVA